MDLKNHTERLYSSLKVPYVVGAFNWQYNM